MIAESLMPEIQVSVEPDCLSPLMALHYNGWLIPPSFRTRQK